MKFDVVPPAKIMMRMRFKIAMGSLLLTAILWICLVAFDVFHDLGTAAVLTSLFILFDIFFLWPYVRYGRISQSVVEFTPDRVQFVDAKGVCWRSIPYSSISEIRKETICGTFYGENKHEVRGSYICFFLHNTQKIPDVSYSQLFKHKDFAMVWYQEELFAVAQTVCSTGDGSVC